MIKRTIVVLLAAVALNSSASATTSIPWGIGFGTLNDPDLVPKDKPRPPPDHEITYIPPWDEDNPHQPDDPLAPWIHDGDQLTFPTPDEPFSPTVPETAPDILKLPTNQNRLRIEYGLRMRSALFEQSIDVNQSQIGGMTGYFMIQ